MKRMLRRWKHLTYEEVQAKVDEGTVYMFHGYSEADVNSLLDGDKLDPYSGFPAYRSNRVGIRKKVQ